MKFPILILLFLLLSSKGISASDSLTFNEKNSLQIELGGNGLFYSLIYERIILNGKRFKTTAQMGVAYYPPQTGVIDLCLPFLVNELFSFNKHHIELGLGYVFTYSATRDLENNPSNWEWEGFYTGRLGYRFQKPSGRIILRAAFTPFIEGKQYSYQFHPSGGVAIGYTF